MIRYKILLVGLVFSVGLLGTTELNAQSYKNSIGLTRLLSEIANLEDGTGVTFAQTEAPLTQNGTNYLPDSSDPEFAGKMFNDINGGGTVSSHATNVGTRAYGLAGGIAPGINNIDVYEVNDYLNIQLNFATQQNPFTTAYDVQNHSWIARGLSEANAVNLLKRLDWHVNETNTTMVVGTGNNSAQTTPQLLVHSYNSISVGRSDGGHSNSATSLYGPGRIKPDIVSPGGPTSFATGVVSGAAAILREASAGTQGEQNEVIKALLLGGATKEEFPGWSRSQTSPLDAVYGAGELNIRNSYYMLQAGQHDGSTNPTSAADLLGWDYGESINGELFYDFEFIRGVEDFSVILTWNIDVVDDNQGAIFDPGVFDPNDLANFDLELFDANGILVDASLSTVDNVEHLYFENLMSGDYRLRVSSDRDHDFGLAWRATAVPEPGSLVCLAGMAIVVVCRRRRV